MPRALKDEVTVVRKAKRLIRGVGPVEMISKPAISVKKWGGYN